MSDNIGNSEQLANSRDERTGRYLSGNKGGGRPKGSRNRLGEAFIEDLYSEWRNSGTSALKRMAADEPAAFVRVCAGLLPKEIDATLSVEHELLFNSARDYGAAFRLAKAYLLAQPDDELIEVEASSDES